MKQLTKFTLVGVAVFGLLAFLHVAWDSYKFAQTGAVAVDDPFLTFFFITSLGILIGAVLGAMLGFGISILRKLD